MRPFGDSSIDPLVIPPIHREGAVKNDVTELDLVTDQAEFNAVRDRWFGELVIEEDVRSENERPRGRVFKRWLSTICGFDLPVVYKADVNTA